MTIFLLFILYASFGILSPMLVESSPITTKNICKCKCKLILNFLLLIKFHRQTNQRKYKGEQFNEIVNDYLSNHNDVPSILHDFLVSYSPTRTLANAITHWKILTLNFLQLIEFLGPSPTQG